MQAPPQPDRRSRGEHRAGLVGVEGAGLAEDVDPPGVGRGGLEHRPGDEVDVGRRVVGELGGHDVGPQVRRLLGELARHRERARLVAHGQAVAALGLQRRRALPTHLRDQARHRGGQLLVGGGTGRGDRGADAAGGVGTPGHPCLELRGPVAGVHEVGVGVDEARQHGPPAQVHAQVGRRCRRRRPHPRDPSALDQQRRVVAQPERVVVPGVVGHQLPDAGEQGGRPGGPARTGRAGRDGWGGSGRGGTGRGEGVCGPPVTAGPPGSRRPGRRRGAGRGPGPRGRRPSDRRP